MRGLRMALFIGGFGLIVLAIYVRVIEFQEAQKREIEENQNYSKLHEQIEALSKSVSGRLTIGETALEGMKGKVEGLEAHGKLIETLVSRPVSVTIIDRRSPPRPSEPKKIAAPPPPPPEPVKVPQLKAPKFLRKKAK